MSLLSPLRKAVSGGPVALLEIGSGSVGALYFTRGDDAKHVPRSVFFAKRYPMPLQESLDFRRFAKAMEDSLNAATKELSESPAIKKNGRPHEVHVVFGAPWYLSRSKVTSMGQPRPFMVTDSMLAAVNKAAVDDFLASGEVTTGEQIEHAPKLVEHMPVQVLLNGYPTSRPAGKRVTTFSVAMFESVVSSRVFQTVSTVVYHALGRTPLFHSASLAYYKTIGSIFTEPDNYLIATVEQEVTEVSLVEGDVLRETVSSPLGTNHLLRALTTERKTVPEEALSLYLLATSMQARSGEDKTLEAHLEKARVKALSSFAQTCNTLANLKPLPSKLYLLAEPQFGAWFAQVFADSSCAQYTSLGDPFQVALLTKDAIANAVGAEINQFPDAQLGLEALYVSRFGAQ